LEKTHVNLKITPNDNPAMAFSVAAPRAWTYSKQMGNVPAPKPLAPRPLGFIAASTKPGAPVIAVTVTTIPFEIPVDAWARMSLEHEGWKLAASNWFPGRFGLFFDVTGTQVVDGVEEVRRTSVHKDGSNLFSVNCLTARKHWDDFKEICWVAHGTFELLDATKKSEMEIWRRATTQNPTFEAAYPESWSAEAVKSSESNVSAIDIRLLDASKSKLMAYLQVKASRRPAATLRELQSTTLARLGRSGFSPKAEMRTLSGDDDPRAAAVKGWLGGFVGQGRFGDSDVMMRTGFVQRGGVVFSLTMMYPPAADDVQVALRAQRTFEIVRSTVALAE
jgi:hypothetical protein